MKQICAVLLIACLLLCAACQKAPDPAETPQSPTVSDVPDVPEEPGTPEEPEQPDVPEAPDASDEPEAGPAAPSVPDGLPTDAVALPDPETAIDGFADLGCFTPLTDRVMALVGYDPEGAALLLYDYVSGTVLSRQEVSSHDGSHQLSVLCRDPWQLYYYDGQRHWLAALNAQWEATAEAYDPAQELFVLDGLTITQEGSSIAIGGTVPEALHGENDAVFQAVRVLDDHRLLYQLVSGKTGVTDYGVYDHATGEGRLVTTLGQSVVGVWGEVLLIGRPTDDGLWYDLALMQLTDMTYTPLTLGHESEAGAVEVMQTDDAGTRLLVRTVSGTETAAQLFSLPEGDLLFQWETIGPDEWELDLTGDCLLFRRQGTSEMWQLQY